MLGSVQAVPDDRWPVPPGNAGCYVVTDAPDALFERAVAVARR